MMVGGGTIKCLSAIFVPSMGTYFFSGVESDHVKLESFLLNVSAAVIAGITLYVFYAFFSGQIDGFSALATLIITYVAFGFMIGVAFYLASERRGGWRPEEEVARYRRSTVEERSRRLSIAGFSSPRPRYGRYKVLLLVLVGVGVLTGLLGSPTFGLILICLGAGSYVILHAVEVFDSETEI
jgi:hypothetical protein